MPEREKRELKALWEIARLSSQTFDIERILAVIMKEAAKLLKGDASSIRLLREEDKLELVAGYNLSKKYKSGVPLKVGEGLVGAVARQKRTLLSSDVTRDPKILYPEVGKEEKITSLVCAPLLSKEKLLGTLTVYRKRPEAFRKGETHLLDVIAEQAALVIERATFLEELKEKTIHDELTGLYSRSYFLARCKEELARAFREKRAVSFLFCDVDNFKVINRIQGYKEGDRVLCQVAEAIRSCIREENVVCRYGGDEFAVLLSGIDSTPANKVAERIHKNLSLLPKQDGIHPTLSIGLVTYPEHGKFIEDILSKADSSMTFAKHHPEKKTVVWGEWEKTDLKELYTQRILPQAAITLTQVVDEKNGYTSEHSKLVTKQATLIAEKMGLEKKEIDKIRTAALLHDIGKLAIPAYILNKPGRLTEKEKKIMREHSEAGEKLLKYVRGTESIAPIIRAIHERWDGKGYPDGLKGEKIPLEARIIAVVDSYWTMCSDRPYRKKLKQEKAIKELKKQSGFQFDPKIVQLFIDIIGVN